MEQPPPTPETPPAAATPPDMSLAARLLNVFAAPGEVFEAVNAARASVANWLAPILFSSLVGVVASYLLFSHPAIIQQVHEQQAKAFDQQVKNGKMTQAQADQAAAMAEKFTGPAVMKVAGSVGAVIGSFVRVFWWAFVLWLLARLFLKVQLNYLKTAEVAGLATMISTLGAIVTLLIRVNLGKLMSTPSLALAVGDFDAGKKGHLLLAAVNIFSFWFVGVMSSGLSRLAGVPFARALSLVLGCWILQQLGLIFTGLGSMTL